MVSIVLFFSPFLDRMTLSTIRQDDIDDDDDDDDDKNWGKKEGEKSKLIGKDAPNLN